MSNTRNHVCSYCGKTLSRSTKLREHMRSHTGERPFKCSACGVRFLRSYDLTKHKDLHFGVPKYRCTFDDNGTRWGCGKGFHKKGDLNRHLARTGAAECRQSQQQINQQEVEIGLEQEQQQTHEVDNVFADYLSHSIPKDEDEDDYSSIWDGKIDLSTSTQSCPVSGMLCKLVAGYKIPKKMLANALSSLPDSKARIRDRAEIDIVTDFLSGLQFSQSTERSVFHLTNPEQPDSEAAQAFDDCIDYFRPRRKYAVVNTVGSKAIQDMYLMPCEKGSRLPPFLRYMKHELPAVFAAPTVLIAVTLVKDEMGIPDSAEVIWWREAFSVQADLQAT